MTFVFFVMVPTTTTRVASMANEIT